MDKYQSTNIEKITEIKMYYFWPITVITNNQWVLIILVDLCRIWYSYPHKVSPQITY